MYFDYVRERTPETKVLEKDHGFALYRVVEFNGTKMVYIEDIYVTPEKRQTNLATEMSKEIQELAKTQGINYILGSVVPSTKGSTRSLAVLLAHGMVLARAEDDIIYFYKEIK